MKIELYTASDKIGKTFEYRNYYCLKNAVAKVCYYKNLVITRNKHEIMEGDVSNERD